MEGRTPLHRKVAHLARSALSARCLAADWNGMGESEPGAERSSLWCTHEIGEVYRAHFYRPYSVQHSRPFVCIQGAYPQNVVPRFLYIHIA